VTALSNPATGRTAGGRPDAETGRTAAGYVAVPAHASDTDAETEVSVWRQALAAHAAQRGLQLGAVFVDVRGRTESGVYRLVEHLRAGQAVAVIVPELGHLTHTACLTGADLPTAQRFLRARVLTVEAGRRDRLPLTGPR
jgi:hypothetical protein